MAAIVFGPTMPSIVTPSTFCGSLMPYTPLFQYQSTTKFAMACDLMSSAFHLSQ